MPGLGNEGKLRSFFSHAGLWLMWTLRRSIPWGVAQGRRAGNQQAEVGLLGSQRRRLNLSITWPEAEA